MVPGPCPCPGPWPVVLAPQSSVRYSVFRSGELGVGNRESGIGSSRSVRGQTHFVDARVWTQVSESVHCLLRGVVTLWVVDGGGWRWLEVGGWQSRGVSTWSAIKCRRRDCYCDFWQWIRNAERLSSRSRPRTSHSTHLFIISSLRFASLCCLLTNGFDDVFYCPDLSDSTVCLHGCWHCYIADIYIYICICIHIYAWMWHISFITIDTDFGLPVTPFLV